MNARTVAVLRGGPSDEYDVSLRTGAGVLAALADTAHVTKDILITRDGQWLHEGFVKSPEQVLAGVEVVFLALHGAYGEDGSVQRLLDRYNIPYTGSTAYASAVAMNKILTKDHLDPLGIKMAKHMRVTKEGVHDASQTALSISQLFGPQYVIKPVIGGSSIGTKIARSPQELGIYLSELLQEHDELIVEERIQGREATVGILENFRNEALYSMPVIEIIPPSEAGFFDAAVKYDGTTEEICPGRFTKKEKEALARIARIVHTHLNLRHYSRSDFIVADDGLYFLEVNTLPGLTAESLFPKSVDAVGGTYSELITHLIEQASSN